jgi:hypothetical protein
MPSLKSLNITPSIATAILVALGSLGAAFGAPLTAAQSAAILVFGGAVSAILFTHGLTNAFKYLTPPTLTGLVTTVIGVAVSFGAPITKAQSEAVLGLTALVGGLLLAHGVVHTLARDKREAAPPKPIEPAVPLVTPVAVAGPTPEELAAAEAAGAKAARDALVPPAA